MPIVVTIALLTSLTPFLTSVTSQLLNHLLTTSTLPKDTQNFLTDMMKYVLIPIYQDDTFLTPEDKIRYSKDAVMQYILNNPNKIITADIINQAMNMIESFKG